MISQPSDPSASSEPDTGDLYLIWSHEHGRWWGAGRRGYTRSIAEAGRYNRAEALLICAKAIAGTAQRMQALPELPVRLADVEAFTNAYMAALGQLVEPWE